MLKLVDQIHWSVMLVIL